MLQHDDPQSRWRPSRSFAVAIMPDGDKSQSHLPGPALAAIPPEALLVCPECRLPLPSATFETHLRQVHRIYQFRGVRRSFNDTFAALLDAFVIVPPDAEAWRTLAAIASENQGPRAEVFLATTLAQLLLRVSTDRRTAVVEALGTIIGRSGATSLAVMLASDAETLAHQLSLIVIANLPQPLDAVLIPPLRGLLLDRHLPVEAQLRALAAVLQTAGTEGILAEELLQTLVKGLGKAKSIKRLRRFERLAGKNPLVDALCGQIEDKLRMSCPRCSMELRRPKMIEHLWSEHRLVLDGRRVREPWAMIEEWTELYLERRDPELLDRCRTLVQRLDPEEGPQRLNRLLLTQGIADEDARRGLTAEAAERHAACCPWCFGMVPVPREVPPLLLNRYHGRLSAGGYRIEVSEHGLRTSLEIVTPTARIYHGCFLLSKFGGG